MKIVDELLDRNVLAPFADIFAAMNISEYQIVTTLQDFSLPPLDFETREKLSHDGLLVAENFADEWLEVAEPNLYFKYKKRIVLVYQRDQFLSFDEYCQSRYRPYHLCFCSALRDAHEKNRYESRYVMTYNTSGEFKTNLYVRDKDFSGQIYTEKKEQDIYLPLKVCQHCLYEVNWNHFRTHCGSGLEWWRGGNPRMRGKIAAEFNLKDYLMTAREDKFFDHPVMGTASSTIKKEYVLSPQIKDALKKISEYTCDLCRNQFTAEELQIHHRNHNEGDNRRENLMVVCESCHAQIHEAEGGFVMKKKRAKPANKNSAQVTENVEENNSAPTEMSLAEYAAAQKYLGDLYFNGWTFPQDKDRAKIFYQNAFYAYKFLANADANDVDAQFEANALAEILGKRQRSYKEIFAKYKSLAGSGDVDAKIRLAMMYAKGLGVKKDVNAAKKIITSMRKKFRRADSEVVELCVLMGNIDDAMRFHAKAVQLFNVAAKKGSPDAIFELAKLCGNKDWSGKPINKNVRNQLIQLTALYEAKTADYDEKFLVYSKADDGDVDAILKLKKFTTEGNIDAIAALDKLYYDGDKKHAIGTVILRDNVTTIDNEAFEKCNRMTNIILPKDLNAIDSYAFFECSNLREINIPEGVTSIGDKTFWGCTSLTRVDLPNNVKTIGEFAFYGCDNLREVTLPENLKAINMGTFFLCKNLEGLVLPERLISVANGAFCKCAKLEIMIFPNSLTTIGKVAFGGCSELREVVFPKNLNSIGENAFVDCNKLTSITYYRKKELLLRNFFGDKWLQLERTILDD